MTTGRTFLLRGGVVMPMEGTKKSFDPGSVLVIDGIIEAVGTVDEVNHHPAAQSVEVVEMSGHAVVPGFHNCHIHSGLLRGTAESLALWEWLEKHVDPAHRALTPEIAEVASWMAYTESVRGGTTSVLDMWRFMEGSARAAEHIGIRATLAPYTADLYDYFETMESNRRLLETHRTAADGRVRTWVGLEHIFYCSEAMFRQAAALAEEFDTGIHTHSSESIWEVEECIRQFGRRPIEEFHRRGILGPRTVIAHGVWLDDSEVEVLARTGTSIAHCPCSNMKLASGAARVGYYREQGITVGLGTDGEKENNNLDMLEEMKFASLLQKVSTLDPTVGDPWDILDMATLSGAKALGLGDITGSLEKGKHADIAAIDLRGVHFVPVFHGQDFNVPAHLVFTASSHDVTDVWVQGRQLVEHG
ncbi:MAG: amidohydrolase, partial [Ilumatobacteraceae bacterium]